MRRGVFLQSYSSLANPAVKTRPLPLLDLLNHRAALSARFACSAIDKILLLKIAAAAVAVYEVAQGAAAFFDGDA